MRTLKNTQLRTIISILEERAEVTRNECLELRISRLGALIAVLKDMGYEFDAFYRPNATGKDYVYRLSKRPLKKVYEPVYENGRVIKMREKIV